MTIASGAISTTTLKILGGIGKYLLIRANSSGTSFRADIKDDDSEIRIDYGYHKGELVDDKLRLPMSGTYTINIKNGSYNDLFKIILSVEE